MRNPIITRSTNRLKFWYIQKRKKHIDAEIRCILRSQKNDQPLITPTTWQRRWQHKTEALVGDTIYLGHDNKIQSFVLTALEIPRSDESKISITSPVGQALLGKHQGDRIRLRTLSGDVDYTILKII